MNATCFFCHSLKVCLTWTLYFNAQWTERRTTPLLPLVHLNRTMWQPSAITQRTFATFSSLHPRVGVQKAPRVSLKEWEPNGKLAHQNTSRLPDNRKRPCKLGALWQKLWVRSHSYTGAKKNILLHFTATIVLASLALKKQMLVGQGRAVTMPTGSTNNGSLAETCVCATVWRSHRVTTFAHESHPFKLLFQRPSHIVF